MATDVITLTSAGEAHTETISTAPSQAGDGCYETKRESIALPLTRWHRPKRKMCLTRRYKKIVTKMYYLRVRHRKMQHVQWPAMRHLK